MSVDRCQRELGKQSWKTTFWQRQKFIARFVYNVDVAVDAETQSYTDTARKTRRDLYTNIRLSVCRSSVTLTAAVAAATTAVIVPHGQRMSRSAGAKENDIQWECIHILLAHINRLEVGLHGRYIKWMLKEIIWHQHQQHRPIHSERQKYVVDIGVAVMACDLYIYLNIYLISSHRIVSHVPSPRAHKHSEILIFLFSSSWLLARPHL